MTFLPKSPAERQRFEALWFDATLELPDIARLCGVGVEAVRRRALRWGLPSIRHPRLSAETKAAVVELYLNGEEWATIASRVGVDRSYISTLVRAANVQLRTEREA